MKIEARAIIGPLVAAVVLIITLQQTTTALHRAGHWSPVHRSGSAHIEDPYARLDQAIERANSAAPGTNVRDPFAYGSTPVATVPHVVRHHVVIPPPIPEPVLTAIIWDNDPRALIRFNGREYTVHPGGLFADYRVNSITRDRVVILDRDGHPSVLYRPFKGE